MPALPFINDESSRNILGNCISLNNHGVEYIEQHNHLKAIQALTEAISPFAVRSSLSLPQHQQQKDDHKHSQHGAKKHSNCPSNEDSNSPDRQAELPDQPTPIVAVHRRPLFDIDALFPKRMCTTDMVREVDGSAVVVAGCSSSFVYKRAVRLPMPLAGCRHAEHPVKVILLFNLALAYHLAGLVVTPRSSSPEDGKKVATRFLRRASELYQLALRLQPTCAESSRAFFTITTMNNLGRICISLGDSKKRDCYLRELVSTVIFMTSCRKADATNYEVFLETSLELVCDSICASVA